MKKILQIARYDFKRLALNPITLIGYAIVLVACLILGFAYKIPATPQYSASLAGETTHEVFNSFVSNNTTLDIKENMDAILNDAKILIDVQNSPCLEAEQLTQISHSFDEIWSELERYNVWGQCEYTISGTAPISQAANKLLTFIQNFKSLSKFHTKLVLSNSQMSQLEEVSKFFTQTINNSTNTHAMLQTLYNGKAHFNTLKQVSIKAFTFNVDNVHLESFNLDYIQRAEIKLTQIYAEMLSLRSKTTVRDVENVSNMKALATNYKLTCESAKKAIENEYTLLMDKLSIKINKMYGYGKFSLEETKLYLSVAKHFLEDDNLYFSSHQQALNFNTASYKRTAFDHSYFMMCIVGFLTVLFGIFCAYKLFGRDRRNGKMDLILSQKVTFNQVFIGKFLAVLWSTSFCVLIFAIITMIWGSIFYGFLPGSMLAVFNLNKVYTISPFLFLLIKLIGIELQAIFYSVLTIFLMNVTRKFDIMFAVALAIFVASTVCNIFLNGQLWWCLLPFIHADITCFLGGATMSTGFLKTSLFSYGNFFISFVYYIVLVGLLFAFTKQLFKKN